MILSNGKRKRAIDLMLKSSRVNYYKNSMGISELKAYIEGIIDGTLVTFLLSTILYLIIL